MARSRELPRIQRLLAIHLEDDRREEADFQRTYQDRDDASYTPDEAEKSFSQVHPMLGQVRSYRGADINTPVTTHDAGEILFGMRLNRDEGFYERRDAAHHYMAVNDVQTAVANRHNISPLRRAVGE